MRYMRGSSRVVLVALLDLPLRQPVSVFSEFAAQACSWTRQVRSSCSLGRVTARKYTRNEVRASSALLQCLGLCGETPWYCTRFTLRFTQRDPFTQGPRLPSTHDASDAPSPLPHRSGPRSAGSAYSLRTHVIATASSSPNSRASSAQRRERTEPARRRARSHRGRPAPLPPRRHKSPGSP